MQTTNKASPRASDHVSDAPSNPIFRLKIKVEINRLYYHNCLKLRIRLYIFLHVAIPAEKGCWVAEYEAHLILDKSEVYSCAKQTCHYFHIDKTEYAFFPAIWQVKPVIEC